MTTVRLKPKEDLEEKKSIVINNISFWELWRLFVPGVDQKGCEGFVTLEEAEPQYLYYLMTAFSEALTKKDLDIPFLSSIHWIIAKSLDASDGDKDTDSYGMFRTVISCMEDELESSYVTQEGLDEIIDKIKSGNHSYLSLETELDQDFKSTLIDHTYLMSLDEVKCDEIKKSLCKNFSQGKRIFIKSIFKDKINTSVKFYLNQFIQQYQMALQLAEDNEEKILKAIIQFVKDCEHLSPFNAGNERLFYMVIFYSELLKHGLALPLMTNINRLCGYSIDQLIVEYQTGKKNAEYLFSEPDAELFGIKSSSILPNNIGYLILSALAFAKFLPVPPSFKKEQLESAIYYASYRDNIDSIKKLIDARTHKKEKLDCSAAFLIAIEYDYTTTIKLLLHEKGVHINPNKLMSNGETLLYQAVLKDNIDLVQTLLDAGGDPNVTGKSGMSPLLLAIHAGNATMVRAMLNSKIKPNFKVTTSHHLSVLGKAVIEGRTEIVRLLLQEKGVFDLEEKYMGDTLLVIAARCGDKGIDIVQCLLEAGANPNVTSSFGKKIIHMAIESGNAPLVELLAGAKGIDLEAKYIGCTALLSALKTNHYKMVDVLVKAKADLSVLKDDKDILEKYFDEIIAKADPKIFITQIDNFFGTQLSEEAARNLLSLLKINQQWARCHQLQLIVKNGDLIMKHPNKMKSIITLLIATQQNTTLEKYRQNIVEICLNLPNLIDPLLNELFLLQQKGVLKDEEIQELIDHINNKTLKPNPVKTMHCVATLSGSYNASTILETLDEGGTHVFRRPLNQTLTDVEYSMDDFARTKRVWNEYNPEHKISGDLVELKKDAFTGLYTFAPATESDRKDKSKDIGMIFPYFKRSIDAKIDDEIVARKILEKYKETKRIVLDGCSDSNFKKDEKGNIVLVDVGIAYRSNSTASLNFWKKLGGSFPEYWDKQYNRMPRATVVIRALLKLEELKIPIKDEYLNYDTFFVIVTALKYSTKSITPSLLDSAVELTPAIYYFRSLRPNLVTSEKVAAALHRAPFIKALAEIHQALTNTHSSCFYTQYKERLHLQNTAMTIELFVKLMTKTLSDSEIINALENWQEALNPQTVLSRPLSMRSHISTRR